MAQFCLTKQQVEKVKKAFADGSINPSELSDMSSEERRSVFSEYVGESNAKEVNALFESKLLLRNQQRGMISWANRVLNGPPEIKRDIVSRILKMDKVLQPKSEGMFFEDLAAKKLGISITAEEAKKITELSQEINKKRNFSNEKERIDYGNALLDMEDYVNELTKTKGGVLNRVVNTLNLPRTAMSTLDLSAPLRQGWGLMSRPEYRKAFAKMFKHAASEEAYTDLMADIITRPTYDLMKSSKLRITKLSSKLEQREEAFMSNLIDRFPGVKGSERAYTGFLNKLRADVFDSMVAHAEAMGEDVTKGSKTVNDIAEFVNNFTGSGNIGQGDKYSGAVPFLNGVLFSPRKIAATINMFNPASYVKMSPVVRQQALKQLFASIGMTSMVLAMAALAGAEVELNPTSSDFGKIKIGSTRFDFTGGNGNYITLLARLLTGSTKSSVTGLSEDLNGQFGNSSRADVTLKYMRNKLSPVASFVADALYGKNAVGDTFELAPEIANRIIPMTISGAFETLKTDPQLVVFSSILGSLGVGVSTYSSDTNWNSSTSKELQQFKEKAGQDTFDEANNMFNEEYKNSLEKLQKNTQYMQLSDEDKAKQITKLKTQIKEEVFRKYHFKYKEDTKKKVNIRF